MQRNVRIIILLLLIALVGGGVYFGYTEYEKRQSALVPVLTVSQEIPPRTMITQKMFDDGVIKVSMHPAKIVPPNVFRKPEDVLNKFTATNYTVPPNSYLYVGKVLTAEEMKDGAAMLLNEGEKMIAINTNLRSSLAAQITEGSYIDLWLSAVAKEDKKPVIGPFLEKVRVIGTYATSSQKSRPTTDTVTKNSSDEQQPVTIGANVVPQTILLAVNNEQIALIQLAEKLGTIQVAGVSYKDYGKTTSATDNGLWSVKRMREWMTAELSKTFQVLETTKGDAR
jgi:Flp pilus assembly protein CpaB